MSPGAHSPYCSLLLTAQTLPQRNKCRDQSTLDENLSLSEAQAQSRLDQNMSPGALSPYCSLLLTAQACHREINAETSLHWIRICLQGLTLLTAACC
eukprot:9614676-Lingulodinium_polyedra.AAC.1